jgi:hypothetical protein
MNKGTSGRELNRSLHLTRPARMQMATRGNIGPNAFQGQGVGSPPMKGDDMRCLLRALLVLTLLAQPCVAFLTDTGTHTPPTRGRFAYETWTPDDRAFPDVNRSYVDPVFGEKIVRVTDIFPVASGDGIIYGINGQWNADMTAYLRDSPSGGVDLIHPFTGALIRANVPYPYTTTDAISFDPVNPALYYYTNGTQLVSYNINTAAITTVKTFSATLGGLGQSADWIDRTGRYFLLNHGNQLRIWDKQADVLYSGGVPVPTGSNGIPPGWAGLSPDGNYVIISLNPEHYSYQVDHANRRLITTAVMFWDACFDHGDVMSASDGQTYLMTADCLYGRGYYRVRVTNNAVGRGAAQLTLPGNVQLLPIGASNTAGNGHFACAAKGARQDWCYASIEDPADQLGNPGPWYSYKQEIVLAHMLPPFEVRRLVHHRARPEGGFCRTARVNTSWDGTAVMFASPYSTPDTGECGYSDLYRIDMP